MPNNTNETNADAPRSDMSERDTQWHQGFCGAARMEFTEDRERLLFLPEYTLNTKPILIDLLIIRKLSAMTTVNVLGHIFRGFNIFEFKSPGDHLGIDEYFAILSYAGRLTLSGYEGKPIRYDDITLSAVRYEKPNRLMKFLRDNGMETVRADDGIYYVENHRYFPMQIIVTRELKAEEHTWLSSMRRDMTRKGKTELMRAMREVYLRGNYDELHDIEALFSVIYAENRELMEQNEEGFNMKDFFFNMAMDTNKEKFAAIRAESEARGEARGIGIGEARGEARGKVQGIDIGKVQGIFSTLFSLVRDGILSISDAAVRAGTSIEDFTARMNAWSAAEAQM